MRNRTICFLQTLCLCALGAVPSQANEALRPLSVIDWLDQQAAILPAVDEPPIVKTGQTPKVTVTPLNEPTRSPVGLVPTSVTGLPDTLWSRSQSAVLTQRLTRLSLPRLPAAQSLLYSLVLTEAAPPIGASDQFDLARIDLLIRMGAFEPGLALLERAGPDQTPAHFARFSDLQLIAGDPDALCRLLVQKPGLSDDRALEVYCKARLGDWDTAVLLFGTSDALGLFSPTRAAALTRFLDPELFEGDIDPPGAGKPDALIFALFDANGERLPTRPWPLIYANADLDARAGWKAQLEAAERLAQTGALPENRLLGLFTQRKPAASGGIWDRVDAIQRLDQAVQTGSAEAVAKTLPAAWLAAQAARIERPFAALFGELVKAFELAGTARQQAFDIALLSPQYSSAIDAYPDLAGSNSLATGLARGDTSGANPESPLEGAVIDGFSGTAPDATAMTKAHDGRLGEAILDTLELLHDGTEGDLARLPVALATMRALGLEDAARQASLQLLLLGGRT